MVYAYLSISASALGWPFVVAFLPTLHLFDKAMEHINVASHLNLQPPPPLRSSSWIVSGETEEGPPEEIPRWAMGINMVKHRFVHMSLHPDWLAHPLQIDINQALMVSVNGGSWHGSAPYCQHQ